MVEHLDSKTIWSKLPDVREIQNIFPGESQESLDNCDSMIEHPDSNTIWPKLSNFRKNCKVLENGEMNPEKQDNCLLHKEEIPVIKKKKPIRRTMKKRKSRTKVSTLSESSELDLKKAFCSELLG